MTHTRRAQWALAILMASVWTVRVIIWGARMVIAAKHGHHGI